MYMVYYNKFFTAFQPVFRFSGKDISYLIFLNYIDKHFILLYNSCERRKGMGISMTADPSYSENNMRYPEKVISDIDSRKANLAEHNLIEA